MQTSIIAVLTGTISFLVAFFLGRLTSTASVARRRYSTDAGKPPLWLKNYKSNAYTRTIYERLLTYFEREKPYLDSSLSIDAVARTVGTNRTYIAKAVKVYTGRNFCQFVNFYRIEHAIALYENDTSLRVNQLAGDSGFNSATSFSIAFKLVKGMPPGEWCRRCKAGVRQK
ncbi:MAG: helix-turn-helix transcriptional regulator [Bacteroidales bacterium]|nr:helix-turn-helix transcriptional regulator [Candidatus Hennigimonas equi]